MSCGRERKRKRKHPSRDLLHINHIERSIEDLRENVAGRPESLQVRWNLLAAQRALQTLFESADKLSEELKAVEPDIDWSDISEVRNRIAHEYLSDEIEVVRDALAQDLPPLAEAIGRLRKHAEERQAKWTRPPQSSKPTLPDF